MINNDERCQGRTAGTTYNFRGHQCRNRATPSGFCKTHDPDLAAARQKERWAEQDRGYKAENARKFHNKYSIVKDFARHLDAMQHSAGQHKFEEMAKAWIATKNY